MELNFFMRELEGALIERGIPSDTAKKHVLTLKRTFTTDDLSEIDGIKSSEEVEQLADSIAVILNKHKKAEHKELSVSVNNVPQQTNPIKSPAPKSEMPKKSQRDLNNITPDTYYDPNDNASPSLKGITVFIVGLFLTLPITFSLLAIIFGAFVSVFALLIGLIILGIASLIVVVGAGSGVSLIGIIFGITQLFSFPASGVYEIGLGIIVAGIVLLVSVLIYNLTLRVFPWLIKLVARFLKFVCLKLKDLFFMIRKECYKL